MNHTLFSTWEAAEAEVERLREVLRDIQNVARGAQHESENFNPCGDLKQIETVCRAALDRTD